MILPIKCYLQHLRIVDTKCLFHYHENIFYYSVNLYQNKLIHIEMNVIISNDTDKSEFQRNLVVNPSSLCLQRATSLSRVLPSAIPHNCSPLPPCSPTPQTNDMTLD